MEEARAGCRARRKGWKPGSERVGTRIRRDVGEADESHNRRKAVAWAMFVGAADHSLGRSGEERFGWESRVSSVDAADAVGGGSADAHAADAVAMACSGEVRQKRRHWGDRHRVFG